MAQRPDPLPWLTTIGMILVAGPASAQDLPLDLLGNGTVSGQGVLLFLLIAALGVAPALLIVVTCFPFIATVLSILRHAIGLQQSPPNMLIVSLALFLTYFVMEPVFSEAWRVGLGRPYRVLSLSRTPFCERWSHFAFS